MSNPYAPPEDRPAGPPEGDERAAPSWGVPPGHQPVAPPAPHRPEPDPDGVARARRLGRVFAVLLLAAVLTSTFPVPWQAAGLVFAVVALVVGVRALVTAVRARQRGTLTAVLGAGLGLTAVWVFISLGMTLMWPAQLDRQECLAGALTISARQACETQFEQDLDDWRSRLQERTRP